MGKHAYLILAHSNWEILKAQLQLLDYEQNDLYIHIDKKAGEIELNQFRECVKKSKIYFVKRNNIYWADYSMVDITLKMLSCAYRNGEYRYYHLLSGVDLPLKPQKYIHEFFTQNDGKEFIGIVPKEVYYSIRHIKFYHLLLANNYYRKSKLLKGIDRLLEYSQRILHVNRLKNEDLIVVDGWQWFSVTQDFVQYIISKKDYIRRVFSYSIASDELFMQTMIWNSSYKDNLYDINDLKNGSMRYIDWKRGKPYTFGNDTLDFEELINSPYLFARKFDEHINMDIVYQIKDYVLNKEF